MNKNTKTYYVDSRQLRDFATGVLAKIGMVQEDAAIVADTLVEADLRGVDSHGIIRLAPYIRMIAEGNMNPRPKLSILRETPVTALIDADDGVGNLVSVKATEIAIQKARNSGVGIVGVRSSTHNGAQAYYPMMAMKHDMIGLMTTNVPPLVPIYGGITRFLGTNPYAAAIPAGKELPVVIDMATTTASMHKIRMSAISGKKIPLGWGLDRDGEPTEDPNEVLEHGFFTWLGGAKGYSLAMLANILSGVLTGGYFNPQTFQSYKSSAESGSQKVPEGHFIIVLSINNFIPVAEFKSRMDTMAQDAKASMLAKGFNRVYLPGERGFEQKNQRLKTGIPVSHMVWERLLEVKEKFSLSDFS